MKITSIALVSSLAIIMSACNSSPTSNNSVSPANDQQPAAVEDVVVTDQAESSTYTLTDVSAHPDPDNCWIVIEGKVYDVTEYTNPVNKHPGGPAIFQGCGTDATAMFNNLPNGSGSHSDKARSFAENYYIGDLVE
jgi:cytochrome b involved in lipid metabolism